jgi:RNA polymerase sporulation-specific sigma factor
MRRKLVEICGVDTSELKTLREEEKRELLVRAQAGDLAARDELTMGNLRLVLSVIQRFNPKNESIDDLFQVGCLGLLKAIDNFNLDMEVRFSTYAVPMIIGEIRRYQRDNNAVRVARSIRDLAYRALQAKEAIARAEQREATLAEIARMLDCTEEAILEHAKAPTMAQVYKTTRDRPLPYYWFVVGNHMVFYVVMGDVMEVRRFIYGARDLNKMLP